MPKTKDKKETTSPAAPVEPVKPTETPAAQQPIPPEEKPIENKPEEKNTEGAPKKFNPADNFKLYNDKVKKGLVKRPKRGEKARALKAAEEKAAAKAAAKLAVGGEVTAQNDKVRKTTSSVTDEKVLGIDSPAPKTAKEKKQGSGINPTYLYIGLGALGIVGVGFAIVSMTKKAKAPVVKTPVVEEKPAPNPEPTTIPFDAGGGLVINIPRRQ